MLARDTNDPFLLVQAVLAETAGAKAAALVSVTDGCVVAFKYAIATHNSPLLADECLKNLKFTAQFSARMPRYTDEKFEGMELLCGPTPCVYLLRPTRAAGYALCLAVEPARVNAAATVLRRLAASYRPLKASLHESNGTTALLKAS